MKRPAAIRRRMVGIGVVWSAACLLQANAFGATLDLEPRWKPADHVDYVLTKHGVVTDGLRVVVDTTNTTPIRVEVLKADATGYLIGWTQGATQFDAAATAGMSVVMKKMSAVMVGRRLELRVDPRGRLQRIENWTQIRDVGNLLVEDVSTLLVQSGVDEATRAQAQAQIRAMFASEQSIRLSSAREIQLMLLVLGHAYDTTRPVRVDTLVPDPTGTGEARASLAVTIDADTGSDVRLRWTQAGSAASVSGNAVVDRATGWPSVVAQVVSAAAQGAQRTETTSLRRQ